MRDEWSRFVFATVIFQSPNAEEARGVLDGSFRKYGLPKAIRSDNGAPFACTRALGGLTKLSAQWIALGIKIDRMDPGNPQQNGGHERMHRDIRGEIETSPANDVATQQELLEHWRFEFNHERPHEALDLKTPAEVYSRSPRRYSGKRPEVVYPDGFEVRVVQRNGCVKYHQRRQFVSEALASWPVGLEHSDQKLRVWFADRLLGVTDSQLSSPIEAL